VLEPVPRRHLKAVPEELDPLEALGRALGEAAAAPDLGSAFGAIAGWLAQAVGARTALVIAADPENDILARHLAGLRDAHAPAAGPPRGAVVVVVPSAGANDEAQITDVVHAFAQLAELCVAHALRLQHADGAATSARDG
jgi:hypothetical protein